MIELRFYLEKWYSPSLQIHYSRYRVLGLIDVGKDRFGVIDLDVVPNSGNPTDLWEYISSFTLRDILKMCMQIDTYEEVKKEYDRRKEAHDSREETEEYQRDQCEWM